LRVGQALHRGARKPRLRSAIFKPFLSRHGCLYRKAVARIYRNLLRPAIGGTTARRERVTIRQNRSFSFVQSILTCSCIFERARCCSIRNNESQLVSDTPMPIRIAVAGDDAVLRCIRVVRACARLSAGAMEHGCGGLRRGVPTSFAGPRL
jgi:hypothetical protein